MLNVEGERSRWSREFSRPRFKRVSNNLLEARRLVRVWGGRQGTGIGTGKGWLGQSSGNHLGILPAFVGKERVTKFWEARVPSTCPQFVSRAKRECEIFYVFSSGKSMPGERVGSLGPLPEPETRSEWPPESSRGTERSSLQRPRGRRRTATATTC